jgi:hypothetical protein
MNVDPLKLVANIINVYNNHKLAWNFVKSSSWCLFNVVGSRSEPYVAENKQHHKSLLFSAKSVYMGGQKSKEIFYNTQIYIFFHKKKKNPLK